MLTINWRVESISFILTETFKMFFKGISKGGGYKQGQRSFRKEGL